MTPLEKRNELLSKTLITHLERRHFEAYYCHTAAEALDKALSLIPAKSSVSWGGSMTIRDMGLTKALHAGDYTVIDRDLANGPEELMELNRQGLLVDYYITSTNAISQDGVLVNIDGIGNRAAALVFGPKNVIVLCSMNKVTSDMETAVKRVRNTVAPINNARLMSKTPCTITGTCHNCLSPDCICNHMVVTRNCHPTGRIKIILIGETLGY